MITLATKPVQPDGQTVDVTTWAPHDDYPVFPVGSKPKRMLVCPADFLAQGHSYLFKTAVGWQRQQVWSEVIAYKVGAELGLPVPPCFIALDRRTGETGTLIEFFYGYPGESAVARLLNQGRNYEQIVALGFQGYPAFSLRRSEHSVGVLQTLMRRMPPRSRPDYKDYQRQFRITPDATPSDFALLGATEAKLPSDGFSVVDPLDAETRQCDLMLEIAGFRYYVDSLASPSEMGQPVEILPEPENKYDPGAVQVRVHSEKVGNINRLQAPTFLKWLAERRVSGVLERLTGTESRPRAFIFVRVRAIGNKKAA